MIKNLKPLPKHLIASLVRNGISFNSIHDGKDLIIHINPFWTLKELEVAVVQHISNNPNHEIVCYWWRSEEGDYELFERLKGELA